MRSTEPSLLRAAHPRVSPREAPAASIQNYALRDILPCCALRSTPIWVTRRKLFLPLPDADGPARPEGMVMGNLRNGCERTGIEHVRRLVADPDPGTCGYDRA